MTYLFTLESVTEGHHDKVCNYISDTIVDECYTFMLNKIMLSNLQNDKDGEKNALYRNSMETSI